MCRASRCACARERAIGACGTGRRSLVACVSASRRRRRRLVASVLLVSAGLAPASLHVRLAMVVVGQRARAARAAQRRTVASTFVLAVYICPMASAGVGYCPKTLCLKTLLRVSVRGVLIHDDAVLRHASQDRRCVSQHAMSWCTSKMSQGEFVS